MAEALAAERFDCGFQSRLDYSTRRVIPRL